MRGLFFLISLLVLSNISKAQFNLPCVDSNRIQQYFQCNDPRFQPICGCNFVTYRNDCVSFNNHGVNLTQYEGVCQNDFFFFDFYPNLVTYNFNFFLQFFDKGNARLEVRDAFGKLMFFRLIPTTHNYQFTIDASFLRPGVYFLSVNSGGIYKVKTFVRMAN